jgi:hypothetical protein
MTLRSQLRTGRVQFSLRFGDSELERTRVQVYQGVPGMHELIVVHIQRYHSASYARCNRHGTAVDVRIIRRDPVPRGKPVDQGPQEQHNDSHYDHAAHPRASSLPLLGVLGIFGRRARGA